jgi:hypothetical protein
MSDDGPCNCEQALELQEKVGELTMACAWKDTLLQTHREALETWKELKEVAEMFLTNTCACATLHDQGAICKHCRLREVFKKLEGR